MTNIVTVAQLHRFDEIIDVRTPAEYREDHIPGAVNYPVLEDEERVRVGTLYKQVSAFEAKKLGAALVARNIARHLETAFTGKPKDWRPLVYCWRGGKRSGSMTHILNQIGWKAAQLDGGYKAYRRQVLDELETLPAQFRFRVICGLTGSGKSRLLQAIEQLGAQALDLENLAAHRGSVLGNLPDAEQPSQKMFESLVWQRLKQFDPAQPVYVEAESKKIGNVRVPDSLLSAMWGGQCIRLEVESAARIQLLKEEYAHFLADHETLNRRLDLLTGLYGHELISRWKTLAQDGAWDTLVAEMLAKHYDPAYTRSTLKHYPQLQDSPVLRATDLGGAAMLRLARQIITHAATQ